MIASACYISAPESRHNLSSLALARALRPTSEGIEFFGVPLGVTKHRQEPFVEVRGIALGSRRDYSAQIRER